MATEIGIPECFSVGSLVTCRTCSEKEVEGEVLAFDQKTRMLILKSNAARSNLNNIQILNLNFISHIQIKQENATPPPQPPSLNVQRLNDRAQDQVNQKKRLVTALRAGVSPDGQRLFAAIKKTIEEVTWLNEDIVVFAKVCIVKPYTQDCVRAFPGTANVPEKMIDHVRKIVDKHVQDREAAAAAATTRTLSGGGSGGTRQTLPPTQPQ